MTRISSVVLLSILAASPALISSQQRSSAPRGSEPTRISVNAPFAQRLIVRIRAMHPEIQKLSLHAVPLGQTKNAIVASNIPEKIGKVSSPGDLRIVASGQPQAVRIEDGRFWDTFVPLHDRTGAVIGFLVMEVPFSTAATQDLAVAKGIEIRNQVEQEVPKLEVLFSDNSQ
jgi:hypothetical protein